MAFAPGDSFRSALHRSSPDQRVHVVAVTDNEGSMVPSNRAFQCRNLHRVLRSANETAERHSEQQFVCRYGRGVHAVQA